MQAVNINDTRVRKTYTVKADDLNGYGLLHGGRLLTLADEIGFLAAYGCCHCDCLTVAVHRARFHRPAKSGDALQLEARVALTGSSSLWTNVEISNASATCIMDAVVVYAAVDKHRHPQRIGRVRAETADEIALQQRMRRLKNALREA